MIRRHSHTVGVFFMRWYQYPTHVLTEKEPTVLTMNAIENVYSPHKTPVVYVDIQ